MPAKSQSLGERLDLVRVKLRSEVRITPKIALVLGSGLGGFADTLEESVAIPYEEIDGMPVSGVEGHAGNLVFGRVGGVPVVAMQGRVHLYEGHSADEVVFGTRLMARLGAESMVITNAAGGISPDLDVGDLMLIEDHLNLTGRNCLVGPNEKALGPRFPDMTEAYDRELRDLAIAASEQLGFALKGGVYAGLLGPTYETPAEIRMLRTLGAQAVGMSTVLEVIAARHMGMRCLGISCITNKAAGLGDEKLDHAEVQVAANQVHDRFVSLLRHVIEDFGNP
ncbi:MAG: purine-nucleoside phosphorylase [Myxococcales bacterium]|nr:purine-nucleoside phosphorylase [Myxococcales bacterium]